MILVTRLNGSPFALNPDLIERADATPDTVITLTSGAKYVVAESLAAIVDLVRTYRASVVTLAGALPLDAPTLPAEPTAGPERALRVVPLPSGEA